MAVFKDSYTNTWACKFRYTNWQGETRQHKKTGFKTQKEAKEYEKAYLDKQQNNCDMSFKALYSYYIEDCTARMKPITVSNKESAFKTAILPYFGEKKVNEISPVNIRQWQTKLIKDGTYKNSTLRKIHKQLSAIFNYAIKVYGLKQNPCSIVGNVKSVKSDEMKYWTLDEFNKFMDAIKGMIDKEAFFLLLFYSGMRIGEACALTFEDFDFENNTVSISKNYVVAKGKVYIYDTKTQKSNRTIKIPKIVMNKIREYSFHIFGKNANTRLFDRSEMTYRDCLNRYSAKANVKKIRIHDLRHSHASLLINMGIPVKQISERLGHDDVTITLTTYAHMYKEKEEELISELDKLVENSNKIKLA